MYFLPVKLYKCKKTAAAADGHYTASVYRNLDFIFFYVLTVS